MPSVAHSDKIKAHAAEKLKPAIESIEDRTELIKSYKRFLKIENHRIKMRHRAGAGGVEVASKRSELLDVVLRSIFELALERKPAPKGKPKSENGKTQSVGALSLIANGGYGRGVLNPASDIDLLFLCEESTTRISKAEKEVIEQILYMLWDVGFKVGHAVRSIRETIRIANDDHQTKTALLDARLVAGDEALFHKFEEQFVQKCILGHEEAYLGKRVADIKDRHRRNSRTVYLQEPNVKEGCGGLRDYHNLVWTSYVKLQTRDLADLVKQKRLTETAYKQIENAYEFLMRVRNGLHYAQKSPNDVLTLRIQGLLATRFGYPQKTILRRCEAFMRDYYRHTRNLYLRSVSLMESFELELQEEEEGLPTQFINFLARRKRKVEHFDGFYSKEGLIYPENPDVFEEDSSRMMRLFRHTQRRGLNLSPSIRTLIKRSRHRVNRAFRYSRTNREVFEDILHQRGDVARVLRQMHLVGFLGRYLPEFGALDCLVQHEFFHRYTADEHTLQCIEQLDKLADTDDPKAAFFQKLFRQLEDPFILYLALILHDTGRSQNFRHHEDASALLASKVCNRLRITGDRRRRLIFLVDHHLTFWRTATTKNIEDPNTISEFASAMKNQSFMEALFLFTYVDSKGTSQESWNDWKASLMMHLYRSTSSYFKDQKAFAASAQRRTEEAEEQVRAKLSEDFADEIAAHFDNMPERYFRFRSATSVTRHIKLFRRFFKALAKNPEDSLFPMLQWEARPDEGYSMLELVCWNRANILSRVAGALTAKNLNILSADIFTRSDDLVLDIFRVCTTNFEPVTSKRIIADVQKLLRSDIDMDGSEQGFHELIEKVQKPSRYLEEMEILEIPQRVLVSNTASPDYTVLEMQAQDRLGLLYDIFKAIGTLNLDVLHSRISTQKGAAIDTFYLVDEHGRKITDRRILAQLHEVVEEAVGI